MMSDPLTSQLTAHTLISGIQTALLKRQSPVIDVWQYTGQPPDLWPEWVVADGYYYSVNENTVRKNITFDYSYVDMNSYIVRHQNGFTSVINGDDIA
jgi:hypothetical protein